jgi:general secretion pathway protein M
LNTRALAGSPALTSLREQAGNWWRARAPRERQMVMVALALIVVFVGWTLLLQPAWRVAQAAPAQIDQLNAQVEAMKRVAAESRNLRSAAPVSPTQAALALKAATDRLGDKARLTVQGDRATLSLSGVTGDALRGWLGEARSAARARPIEAQIQRDADGYKGSLVVAIGVGP